MDGQSLDFLSKKLAKLKELYPEAFTENKIDWEKLKAAFGDDLNFSQERYHLNWAGKSEVFRVLQQRASATLIPVPEESYPATSSFCHSESPLQRGEESQRNNASENIFIEGENLEVLKVLQKSYFGKIKMIYIDPPYNTGSDSFIYPDRFAESKDEYLKRIGDKDEEGFLLKEGMFRKNSKDSGHYHSNWLSMMYPRLYLARNLLRDDGVIFISIDDNEVHNLRLIMNEIFGEENFVGKIIWQTATDNNETQIATEHEYIICYSKDISTQDAWEIPSEKAKIIQKKYDELLGSTGNQPHIIQEELRKWIRNQIKNGIDLQGVSHYSYVDKSGVFYPGNSANTIPGGYTYDIVHPKTKKACAKPRYGYRFKEETFKIAANNDDVLWGEDETIIPKIKKRINTASEKLKSTYYEDNRSTTNQLRKLFDGHKVFDNPKSATLVKRLCKFILGNNDLILDFFAGSGTTAQAIMELNKEDGGNRKFILVQLPEKTDENSEAYKAGYKTIADICKERIRRVIEKINRRDAEAQSEIFASQRLSGEKIGFKVFKLAPSNFKIWRSDIIENTEDLEKMMNIFDDQVKPNAEKENMFYELLLKSGYPLNVETAYVPSKEGGYYSINSNETIILLEAIDQAIVDAILKLQPKNVIALDKLFVGNDQLKTNTVLQMKDAEIEFRTV